MSLVLLRTTVHMFGGCERNDARAHVDVALALNTCVV